MRAHLGLLLALAACREEGARELDQAKARHAALVEKAEPPQSPKYDEVLALLDQVPPGTKASAEAAKLKNAITSARHPVRAPLAMAPNYDGGLEPVVLAQLAACARLATILGEDGGMTDAGRVALDDCRRRAEKTEWDLHMREAPK
jgi:hypothetical protein